MILLEKVGNLINYVGVQDDVLLKDISQVIEVLESFHKVVKHCFGLTLNPGYQHSIREFCSKYRQIPGITFPVKFHMVEQHIVEYLEIHGDGPQGLGTWSEQAMEACHSDFRKFWSQVSVEYAITLKV